MTPGAQRSNAVGERAEATSASSADPAASMSLLNSLLANPLDAGYEHFHAERGSDVPSNSTPVQARLRHLTRRRIS